MLHIAQGEMADARAILALQKQAYTSEALIYPGIDLPPMTQTLEEMQVDLSSLTVLKATEDDRIVGSVRAGKDGEVCKIGRLIVAPDMQRKGVGTRLMKAIEAAFPHAAVYELFTGERSAGNLKFYQNLGYTKAFAREVMAGLTLVFLRKTAPL